MFICIKFPTRERPQKFLSTLEKYITFAFDKSCLRFIINIDIDDKSTNNIEFSKELERLVLKYNIELYVICSNHKSKIDAINNFGADKKKLLKDIDVILLASDDMIPIIEGYDEIIRNRMMLTYPNRDGILFFNDGFRGKEINTLVIMGMKYYKKFDYIYNPAYISLYADNEFQEVGDILKKQTYFDHCIIRHEHPVNIGQPYDELLKRTESFYYVDQKTYNERKAHNFDLQKD